MSDKIKRLTSINIALVLIMALIAPVQAKSQSSTFTTSEQATLTQYAVDTWQSFVDMTFPNGLPADNINEQGVRALYTSPTNIGAYIWSTITARDLQIISTSEARQRISQTLKTLRTLERDSTSGMFYNWYNPETGAKLTIWPADGSTVYPFLSTVDNGWLATALIVVMHSDLKLKGQAQGILNDMNFGFFEDKNNGLLYGGYWPNPGPNCNVNGFTCFDFGTLNTEPRISSYIGLTAMRSPGWSMALDVTRSLRGLDAADPLRYDFALCHLGIAGECPRKRNLEKFARCPILAICKL